VPVLGKPISAFPGREQERERGGSKNYSRGADEMKITGKFRHTLLCGGRKSFVSLEGSPASPSLPSEKSRVKVKMLVWLERVA
jgi:hypothetical protein